MPSTYTVNLGIEKPATGEQSGTWGDTTNLNFDMLDQAINGCLSLTLPSAGSSGSPNTLAVSDGAVSDGRNKWIEFTDGGDLGATAYVQLTPNDAEKVVFVRNSLSGSRSVILFQGTYDAGRDLEVPAGVDMVVKFSGGGATATTTDLFTKLRATELVLGTDLAIADGGTGASTASDARDNLGLTIGTDVQAYDAGLDSISGLTTAANKMIYTTASDTYAVTDLTSAGRAILDDADAAAQRTTLGLGSIATQAANNVNIDGGTVDGITSLSVSGSSSFNGNVGIGTGSPATNLHLNEVDAEIRLQHEGNSFFQRISTDISNNLKFGTGSSGTERMRIDSSGNVGIGTTSPGAELEVNGDIIADGVYLGGTVAANYLDDYEEGTWTPALSFGGASVGITYNANTSAKYTKIGNVVYYTIYIRLTNKGTSTGNVAITGLPFTVSNSSTADFVNASARGVSSLTFTAPLYATANRNNTTVSLLDNNSGTQALLTNTAFTNSTEISVSGFYYV